MMEVINIRQLSELKYDQFGDKKADEFYDKWWFFVNRMDCKVPETHLIALLESEMHKSQGMKYLMLRYWDTPVRDRSLDMLYDIFRRFMFQQRSERNMAREREAAGKKETGNRAAAAGGGKPKKDGKGRDGSQPRAESPSGDAAGGGRWG